jgi:CBS-domain-containing membrane protein
MRVPPAPRHRERAASPSWLEPDADELAERESGSESGAEAEASGTRRRATPAGTLSDMDPTRVDPAARGETISDRLATGTGQFEVPRPRLALRGSPDDPISRIMTTKVVCARPEMDASLLRARLLERGVSGAPVVDDWGRVVGVVSKTDLLEHEVTSQRGGKTVADIMMSVAFTLPPEAPIGQAAALMAYEGVHRVVVVDHRGCVIGLVSTLDIARWLGWCARFAVGREP